MLLAKLGSRLPSSCRKLGWLPPCAALRGCGGTTGQEHQGGPIDIAENLVEYKSLNFLNTKNLIGFTSVTKFTSSRDDVIYVNSTDGWPNQYGLLKIDNEVISYTGIGSTSFEGCIRGFSGIENNNRTNQPEYLHSQILV